MAVTAPVCPRKTEIGNPSGNRHCNSPKLTIKFSKNTNQNLPKGWVAYSYNSNNKIIWSWCHQSIIWTHSQVRYVTLWSMNRKSCLSKQSLKSTLIYSRFMYKIRNLSSLHVHDSWPSRMQFPLTKFWQDGHLSQ